MALHGAQRQAERDRDYFRDEVARLQGRCADLEQGLLEMARRLHTLENSMAGMSPPLLTDGPHVAKVNDNPLGAATPTRLAALGGTPSTPWEGTP